MTPVALKGWRAAMGLPQPTMALVLGVPVGTYRSWEYGRRHPTGAAAAQIDLLHWLWVKHGRVFDDYRASISGRKGGNESSVPDSGNCKREDKGE